ncbi:2-C-methyl-D-erythritol 4-phosphate cytidylyltransferase [Tessaracoccus lubricantis]|uniref:2-C-methyl-D-erythritol 4-phosphate cytidylyltransferase n=1 Tax=Tessaracoccus lubricantis TaxID=545543 RepID=A0ABP9EZ65_9ACTN
MVAAGIGSRLGAPVPKALVELEGVSLARRAVDALVDGGVSAIVVTIPAGFEVEFDQQLDGVPVPVLCVPGGASRQESVARGLAALEAPADAVVLVHDAARALVPPAVVRSVAQAVAGGAEAVIPVVPVVDSVRRVDDDTSVVVNRARLRAVQTPQGARLGALRAAHAQVAHEAVEVTDDATVCEFAGMHVSLVAGHRDALKITEPTDLVLAGAILHSRKES